MFLDYLKTYGSKTFDECPCNDLDLLACALFSYIDISKNSFFESRSIYDILHSIYGKVDEVFPYRQKDIDRFLKLLNCKRFGEIKIIAFKKESSEEREEQFCACAFLIPNKTCIIAFRGTDSSFFGWKEDCNLALSKPIPSQIEACAFLEEIAIRTTESIQVCGHSKGGNLAIFAASFSSSSTQKCITDVVNFDGPGLSSTIKASIGYSRIKNRIRTYIPRASIVGLLFSQAPDVRIIDAVGPFIGQHSPFLWKTYKDSLCFSGNFSQSAHIASEGIQGIIENLTEKQKAQFIEVLYNIAKSTDCTNFQEMLNTWSLKTLKSLTSAVVNGDKESSELIFHVLKVYWKNATKALMKPKRYSKNSLPIMGPKPKLILASASARRKQILKDAGFDFDIVPSRIEELAPCGILPYKLAKNLATQKAHAVLEQIAQQQGLTNCVILGADTIVALNKQVFGKPKNAEEAAWMLNKLSSETHRVITGVCIINAQGKQTQFAEITRVTFRDLDAQEIQDYIASGEPFDKAGAYGIQGLASVFVEKILGDYSNVVGLPIKRVKSALIPFGVSASPEDLIEYECR